MLDVQLKEYTRPEHTALEKILMERIEKIKSPADYARLLMLFHSFYEALEVIITPYLENSAVADYSQRRKAYHLLDDIRHHAPVELSSGTCHYMPGVHSYHAALGVLYVLEGSTLGGRHISREIAVKINSQEGFTFFTCYGEKTGSMWTIFKTYLNASFTEPQEQEIMKAAQQTFVTFKTWLNANE